MRTMGLILLAAVTLAAVLAAMANIWHEEGKPAQGATFTVVGLDMDTTGSSCPNDCTDPGSVGHCTVGTDCTLGTIDYCVEVSSASEEEFDVDVFLENLPSSDSLLGPGYNINFPDTAVKIVAQTHDSGTVNLQAQPGSSLLEFVDAVPDTVSPHEVNVADFGAAEYNPPFTHGVLGRYTFKVLPGATPGVYSLTLDPATLVIGRDVPPGGGIFDPGGYYANEVDEDGDTVPDDDQVWDGNFAPQYGLIAIDDTCPAGPTPSATPTPTVTLTVTPTVTPPVTGTPAATPGVTPTPVGTTTAIPSGATITNLVHGWNYVCYLGAEQAAPDALADIGTGILAVYHLRSDQAYDTWFPDKPGVGTMANVASYEPLFILMANDAAWPQEPATTPPASLDLAQGWNSICYSGQTKAVETATASIAGQFDVLYVLASDQTWKTFVAAMPNDSSLAELQRFAAVLVLVTQAEGTQWAFDPP